MRVFLTGAEGMLGSRLVEVANRRGHRVFAYDRPELELDEPEAAAALLSASRPDLVIHAAAMTDVDGCESQIPEAIRRNGEASGKLAAAAKALGAACIYISSDYVFDGLSSGPYKEDHPVGPPSVYGRSKLRGEELVAENGGAIVRLSWSFGPDGPNFVRTIASKLLEGTELRVVDDQRGSPTYTRDAAEALFDLGEAGADGIYHLCNTGTTTWFGFARAIAHELGLSEEQVSPCRTDEFPRPAPRPANSRLGGQRLIDARGPMPSWEDALHRYMEEEGWLSPR